MIIFTFLCVFPLALGCCQEKLVGNTSYTLVYEDEEEAKYYGCKDWCIYTANQEIGSKYCFKDGGPLFSECLSEECCHQMKDNKTDVQYILMDHTFETCIYRKLEDISQNPESLIILKAEGPRYPLICLDDYLKEDCQAPHFVTWYDVISRCFHQQTEDKELMDPSFCQPKPTETFLNTFNRAIDNLENIVDRDDTLKSLAEEMWQQTPAVFKDFCPGNFSNMIRYLRVVMTKAPQFMAKTTPSGLPQIQMLICYIYSKAGKKFFATPKVNQAIVEIENSWGNFLSSKESLSVLNNGQFGWKSKCARNKLNMASYKYDPIDKYWGFKSFNDFFSRSLKGSFPYTESRPNQCLPDPQHTCMISYGDTQKLKIRRNLTLTTPLKAKNENYSLLSLFANDHTLANYFVGGSLMQSLFMPFNYHRYHAPVSGTIRFAKVIPGLLYAIYNQSHPSSTTHRKNLENWIQGGLNGFIYSLTYISQVATRAVFVIETERHGHVGAIAIGLQSISSTIINDNIKPGYEIKQGEELGRFQYGGSSGIILVEDKNFKWIKGHRKNGAYYKMGQKIGEFEYLEDSFEWENDFEMDTNGPFWGEALGFPVL